MVLNTLVFVPELPELHKITGLDLVVIQEERVLELLTLSPILGVTTERSLKTAAPCQKIGLCLTHPEYIFIYI